MADIRCPNCGKDNPDFLNVCQFCQTPLTPDSMVHIGDKPTKKNTGELEPVLPEWLRDVRKQARDSAEEDAAEAASMPKIQKDEPPDLLAGLASQSASAEEEQVPDWLASLSPKSKDKPAAPAAPSEPKSDFFAQFENSMPPPASEPEPKEPFRVSGLTEQPPAMPEHPERDELSEWMAQAAEQPAEPFTLEPDAPDISAGWDLRTGAFPTPSKESASQPEEEDLSWLHDLEAESRKTGELSSPKRDEDWLSGFEAPSTSAGASDQDDLSWLNNLSALPASDQPLQEPSQPKDDLSWLNDLGSIPSEDRGQQPSQSKEDLSWLNDLGSLPAQEPAQPPSQPKEDLSWLNAFKEVEKPSQPEPTPPASQADLSWLDELGGISQPSQPFDSNQAQPAEQEDMSWLENLKGNTDSLSVAPFADFSFEEEQSADPSQTSPEPPPVSPRQTAPLSDQRDTSIPDWLKSAAEEPSMPLGPQALDQFREDYHIPTTPEEPFSWKSFMQGIQQSDEEPASPKPAAPFFESDISPPAGDTPALSNQDVDSLFSVDMPDWLSRPEPETSTPLEEVGIHAESGEALAPADLPSWVQAMRPVEAVIPEAGPRVEDMPAEREGPLAGFRGVIPAAPIGSSRRPQPIPLKLQATTEQQAGATLLEQLLADETTARTLVSAQMMISQRMLRWAIAGLMLIVLSAAIFLRSQFMPVSASLPASAADVQNVVMNISDNAPVLVILDYEPALAGEMEAASGPLLDQLVLLRHPHLSFITTSPSGAALVERLLVNTNINQPTGHGYVAGQNYINMGYLTGGESGVLAFIQSPQAAMPASPVLGFSEYAAILLLTDHAESARVWVEQLQTLKQVDPMLASQPLLAVSSAQTGPMLQPYVGSRQINGLISGLADAVRYEFQNNNRPGIARSYWDAFGIGVMMAVALIVLGSLWGLVTSMRTRRAAAVEE